MTAWFKRQKEKVTTTEKKSIPDGLWEKCPKCEEILFKRELMKESMVCPHCRFHFRLTSEEYLRILFGDGQFEELNSHLRSADPLGFKAKKSYPDQLKAAVVKTGSPDVIQTYVGNFKDRSLVLGIMDFSFIGGSMGSVVGEKISRAIDYALEGQLPLILICASGGARMQEGVYSLMQLAKISAKLARFSKAGGLYISILTDPTTGGVSASFGMQGDVILAEPGALIGFAGPRVIKQTIGEDLPEGFQRSEFLVEKGFVDSIVQRGDMRETLGRIIEFAHDGE
ncbi:MAG: acetyl-CoA carboxylase carboxyl transferase subunit beta [Candidatus Marinimicrobia bacterium]|nr:acetyl-CoA carboxylase carboxyl transferase subunit beta [Candidatus Neomarinimicrobiota bacterium]|tara:strand:- start:177 stop:1025 length:849 start_codon:yes stop_codon:yes gene_type:complete